MNRYIQQPVGSTRHRGGAVPSRRRARLSHHAEAVAVGGRPLPARHRRQRRDRARHRHGVRARRPRRSARSPVLARARYRFLEGRFHPYIHVDIGGGEIRHVLDISSAQSDTHPLVDKFTRRHVEREPDRSDASSTLSSRCVRQPQELLGHDLARLPVHRRRRRHLVRLRVALRLHPRREPARRHRHGDRQSGFNIDVQAGLGAHFL